MAVALADGVIVGVAVMVGEVVAVAVSLGTGVAVAVLVAVALASGAGDGLIVAVAVLVRVLLGVAVGSCAMMVACGVFVGGGVGVTRGVTPLHAPSASATITAHSRHLDRISPSQVASLDYRSQHVISSTNGQATPRLRPTHEC